MAFLGDSKFIHWSIRELMDRIRERQAPTKNFAGLV